MLIPKTITGEKAALKAVNEHVDKIQELRSEIVINALPSRSEYKARMLHCAKDHKLEASMDAAALIMLKA